MVVTSVCSSTSTVVTARRHVLLISDSISTAFLQLCADALIVPESMNLGDSIQDSFSNFHHPTS
jgi:hypothetical protein